MFVSIIYEVFQFRNTFGAEDGGEIYGPNKGRYRIVRKCNRFEIMGGVQMIYTAYI